MRVSTGSQDEASQVTVIKADAQERGVTIVKWFKLHGYSASGGMQSRRCVRRSRTSGAATTRF